MHTHSLGFPHQEATVPDRQIGLKRSLLIYAAAVWSFCYGLAGLYWASGGMGFPYGDEAAAGMGSFFTEARPESGGPLIAALGFAGATAALTLAGALKSGKGVRILSGFAWLACFTLVLIVPDIRLLRDLGYSLIGVFITLDIASLNQFYCLAGGVLWGACALVCRKTGRKAKKASIISPSSAARWGKWAVYIAILAALPWAVIRLSWFAGYPLGVSQELWRELNASVNGADPGFIKYLFGSLPILGSLLTLGLIQRWGEVVPRWVPFMGGKDVPPALAIVPGGLVAVILIMAGIRMYGFFIPELIQGRFDAANWAVSTPIFFFLPWGLSLGLATLAYYYRRQDRRNK